MANKFNINSFHRIRIDKSIFIIGFAALLIAFGCSKSSGPSPDKLEGIDAVKAIEIGYKWSKMGYKISSYYTPKAVTFKFPDKRKVSIALPADKMIIAVAPYINYTHT